MVLNLHMEELQKNNNDLLLTQRNLLLSVITRLTFIEKKMDSILERFAQLEIVEFDEELSTVSEESDSKDENLTNNNELNSKAEARQDNTRSILPDWKQEILLHSGGLNLEKKSQDESDSAWGERSRY